MPAIQKTVTATLVAMLGAFSSVAVAQVNYGDFIATEVDFLDVTEVTQTPSDPPALWGAPNISGAGDGLVFNPPAFESVCSDGSSDLTASLLSLTISAHPGSAIFSFGLQEAGNVSLTATPPATDPSTNASVSLGGYVTVTEDSNGPIEPVVIPFTGSFIPTGAFSLTPEEGATPWTGRVLVDVAAHVPDATRAIVQLNNILDANCADGVTGGTITKTPTASLTVGTTPAPAHFRVTKTFSDPSTDEVEVTLTCNGGHQLEQSFMVSEGTGVTFNLHDFNTGVTDCEVRENIEDGVYEPSYDNGSTVSASSCSYENITGGEYVCAITNEVSAATFTAFMDWPPQSGLPESENKAVVTISCNAEIETIGAVMQGDLWTLSGELAHEDSLTATVRPGVETECWATQDINEAQVESSDDCGPVELEPGDEAECTFHNTRFFEGIPVLQQNGLAILVLLLLGAGLVGTRMHRA